MVSQLTPCSLYIFPPPQKNNCLVVCYQLHSSFLFPVLSLRLTCRNSLPCAIVQEEDFYDPCMQMSQMLTFSKDIFTFSEWAYNHSNPLMKKQIKEISAKDHIHLLASFSERCMLVRTLKINAVIYNRKINSKHQNTMAKMTVVVLYENILIFFKKKNMIQAMEAASPYQIVWS